MTDYEYFEANKRAFRIWYVNNLESIRAMGDEWTAREICRHLREFGAGLSELSADIVASSYSGLVVTGAVLLNVKVPISNNTAVSEITKGFASVH